jgi:ABC-2 type transport system permease protein
LRILIELLRYFGKYSKMKLARGMQYRSDFLLGILISFTYSILGPIFQYLIITQCRGYPRWNLKQIILLEGVILLWLGLKDLLFGEVRAYVEAMVKGGEFDRLLLKPYPAIGVILSSGFYYPAFGSIIAGLIVIFISLEQLALAVSWWQILIFIGFFLGGMLLYMAITIFYCILVIMMTYMGRLGEVLDRLLNFSYHPVEILPAAVRIITTMLIPLAVWAYYPAETLLNRLEMKSFVSLGVCVILFWAGIKMWNRSVGKYTSAGG